MYPVYETKPRKQQINRLANNNRKDTNSCIKY